MLRHGRKTAAILLARTASCASVLATSAGHAQSAASAGLFNDNLDPGQVVLMSALLGAVIFSVISAIALIRARNRAEQENARLRLEVGELKAAADRAEALVDEEEERLVAWSGPADAPVVAGSLPAAAGVPADSQAFLAFSSWLKPDSAGRLDYLITRLRNHGEPFAQVVMTAVGRLIEVRGRTVGGSAVVRFRDLTGERLARVRIEARHDMLAAEVETMRAMLSQAPMPIWLRDDTGALAWVNNAYAAAVESRDADDAVARQLELLDTTARHIIDASHAAGPVFTRRLPAVVAGSRRIFDVADVVSEDGSAGIGIDVTEIEAAHAALRREVEFNARTLDQLQTAVAIFAPDRRLKSYNAAYRALFDLDPAFLDSAPEEGAVLDRLRAGGKLPEQADFRSWRNELGSAYRSVEAREFWWHLPDGQTLRVIANPHPQGGMTWVYENVTERLGLESRYNALVSVQGATLDHLSEGVAVFGSDGRLRLHNPSFAAIWSLDDALLEGGPHVTNIVAACRRPGDDDLVWQRLTTSVAGVDENRASIAGRTERPDGRVIDYATVPLPDGQTMVTFVDTTDTVKVERALVDRNEALVAADALKNAFIHHVSYELRSPLTNIIGFAQLLNDANIGPLNDKQREYVGYITSSSAALLTIVNDILDLTTIDAGIMELELGKVDIFATIAAVIEELHDHLSEARVQLVVNVPPDIGSFIADRHRVRQILFNLLSNAISFSADGGHVAVAAARDGRSVTFMVSDEGPGIPATFIDSVFDRFASMPRGGGRGGVGLGLAIVKSLVDLHGGTVEIHSEEGKGARVIVRLPVEPAKAAIAAE